MARICLSGQYFDERGHLSVWLGALTAVLPRGLDGLVLPHRRQDGHSSNLTHQDFFHSASNVLPYPSEVAWQPKNRPLVYQGCLTASPTRQEQDNCCLPGIIAPRVRL